MLRIGITGGVGCGKTTVAGLFSQKFGIPIIDADEITRQLTQPGEAALKAIVDHYGDSILQDDGHLNRSKLRGIIFSDAREKATLESILHPRVEQYINAWTETVHSDYCLIVVPLLFETGMDRLVDRTLVVDCLPQQQLDRVTRRDHCKQNQVHLIMSNQLSRREKLAYAQDVIDNTGDLKELDKQIEILHKKYCSLGIPAP